MNAVYDLMTQHNFRIVRSVRIKVDHNLLANPGAKLENICEIYSHEQAISQCAHFLQGLPNVKVIRCENTAVAARMVAESGRDDVAALSSRACRELYGLDCLAASVQDQGNNFTRFICIAKNLEIYPGADRTSLMMVLPHHPGSLYKVLSRFNALGVNMNKLESARCRTATSNLCFTLILRPRFILRSLPSSWASCPSCARNLRILALTVRWFE